MLAALGGIGIFGILLLVILVAGALYFLRRA
jgi:hypothetical protein